MKLTLLALLLLPCCTTVTTTNPDGSVTKVSKFDGAGARSAADTAAFVAPIIIDWTSGK